MATAETTQGLSGRVLIMGRELRAAGVPVSAVEISDALSALGVVPLADREAVRAGLAATLVKDQTHRRAFDRLFDAYFPLKRTPPAGQGRRTREGDTIGELVSALASGDRERLRELARQRLEDHGDLDAQANVSEDATVFRALRGLNLDAVREALRDAVVDGEGRNALQRRMVEEDLTARMEAFRELLSDEVYSALADELGPDELAQRQRRTPVEEVDFLWARNSDLEQMRAALAPLARRLTRRLSHQRRRARHGRLDIRRTLRRSLSTGGNLVEPRFRRPVAGKPELVLLCDISGSMRAFAKFALELTYALATQFQRVRAFAFVDSLDEVTSHLSVAADLSSALERMERDADVVRLDGQSWYGQCLQQFWEQTGRDLAPRTTVLVVGDARGNFRTSGAEYLQRVRERVHKVYWLNPEPRAQWDTGDSVMSEFARACDGVYEVRNLAQLQAFATAAL